MTENIGISSYCNIRGVTCYMNSILAILQQTPLFADYIVGGVFSNQLQKKFEKNKLQESITYQLYNLFKISMSHNNFKITPNTFRKTISMKNCMWDDNVHQDSQEFLTFLITSIEEEISEKVTFIPGMNFKHIDENKHDLYHNMIQIIANKEWERNIKNEYSLLKTLFTGMSRMKTQCKYCMNESNSFEIFQTMQLSIPLHATTLEHCMDNYIMTETLDKNNMLRCNMCYYMNRSTKNTVLWKTPKILIIHLKRFMTNNYGMPVQKISKMIQYPINNLNIGKYIDILSPDINKNKYNLFAVNCHYSIGRNNINSGHYISYVKNRMNDNWYEFDDSNIKKINNISNIISDKAYMLFYIRDN